MIRNRKNDRFVGGRLCLALVLFAAGLVGVAAAPAGASTITSQGAVTVLTNVSEMGVAPYMASFDEGGVLPNDPIPGGLYAASGLTFHSGTGFVDIGIQDRGGTTPLVYYTSPDDNFSTPIGGGGLQSGLVCSNCGVASFSNGPMKLGLTASDNGTQHLTVWDTSGYIIGQVTWSPTGSDSSFIGLDTGSIPIGFASYGNDDVWNGEWYHYTGNIIYSDNWIWQACGNGNLDPDEDCDDGNNESGDCCDAACLFESAGASCIDPAVCQDRTCDGAGACVAGGALPPGYPCQTDDDTCTNEACDAVGTCVHDSDLVCGDSDPCTQDSCDPAIGCVNEAAPVTGCHAAGKASISLASPMDATKRKASFSWSKGSSEIAEFGDIATTEYSLCLYADGDLLASLTAPAGATCRGIPCWSNPGPAGSPTGVLFKDKSKVPTHDGISMLSGKADDGASAKASLKLKAAGEHLALGDLYFDSSLSAQIVTDDAGCWEVVFGGNDVKKQTETTFKAVFVEAP